MTSCATSARQIASAVASVLCSSPAAISTRPASRGTRPAQCSATVASLTPMRREDSGSGHGLRVIAPLPIQTG